MQMGYLLRLLQKGHLIEMPHSRPMPSIGIRCHELRVTDNKSQKIWRLVYRIDEDAILIADVFPKTTRATPKLVIDNCKRRLKLADNTMRGI